MRPGAGSRPVVSGDGIAFTVPGSGACFFTSLSAGDFTEPTAGQLDALAASLGVTGRRFSRSTQVHGSSVRLVAGPEEARDGEEHDGQVTTSREVICAVRTADCLPVALFSPEAAGVIHAGWRGLAGGVIAEGVAAVRRAGDSEVTAVIGPGARACCYEAGPEVHEEFASLGPKARHADNADLPWIVAEQLSGLGVGEIIDTGACTICSPGPAWHSHRRDGEDAGRSLALAWRN